MVDKIKSECSVSIVNSSGLFTNREISLYLSKKGYIEEGNVESKYRIQFDKISSKILGVYLQKNGKDIVNKKINSLGAEMNTNLKKRLHLKNILKQLPDCSFK